MQTLQEIIFPIPCFPPIKIKTAWKSYVRQGCWSNTMNDQLGSKNNRTYYNDSPKGHCMNHLVVELTHWFLNLAAHHNHLKR